MHQYAVPAPAVQNICKNNMSQYVKIDKHNLKVPPPFTKIKALIILNH
jgi:hypothetical protein